MDTNNQDTPTLPGVLPSLEPPAPPGARITRPLPESSAALSSSSQSHQTNASPPLPTYQPPVVRRQHPRRKLLWVLIATLFLVTLLAIVLANILPQSSNLQGSSNAPTTQQGSYAFTVSNHPHVIIQGQHANISLHNGTNNTVSVKIHHYNSGDTPTDTNLRANQDGDQLTLMPDPYFHDLDYDITAPASTQLQVQVDSGSLAISGISGVDVSTENGSIDVANIAGPIKAHTTNGDIIVRSSNGAIALDDENGSLHLSNSSGQLRAITRSGDVLAESMHLKGQSLLQTENGSIRVNAALDPAGTYSLQTTSGDIELNLPANSAFQLSAHTNSGAIRNSFGNAIVGATPRAQVDASIINGSILVNNTYLP